MSLSLAGHRGGFFKFYFKKIHEGLAKSVGYLFFRRKTEPKATKSDRYQELMNQVYDPKTVDKFKRLFSIQQPLDLNIEFIPKDLQIYSGIAKAVEHLLPQTGRVAGES